MMVAMIASVIDMFSIGIGPSSSHTVGPMTGAALVARELADQHPGQVAAVDVILYGSLSATGEGHGTPGAILAGLEGADPETVDPDHVLALNGGEVATLTLVGGTELPRAAVSIEFSRERLEGAPSNTFDIIARDAAGGELLSRRLYSIGGGFVEIEGRAELAGGESAAAPTGTIDYARAADLLERCGESELSISEIVRANETARHGEGIAEKHLSAVWDAMRSCVDTGLSTTGTLPGGLDVARRAADIAAKFATADSATRNMDLLNAAAMAVNEENAAGRRVVTAPTNGAAGIVPAVLYWALECAWQHIDHDGAERTAEVEEEIAVRFLLTAGGIGALIKARAAISGAELGCQGEVGSACAMAAAGLAEIFGGTPEQVENAAEIGIEHNLGLTCDPVGGLVQIPCIERNAVGAVKAVNAAILAMRGDGTHRVPLDTAIETMRQTGEDMMSKYKETSRGGLAVNVPEC